ncbi:MAG: ion transporter [Pirellulaceae bacterium]
MNSNPLSDPFHAPWQRRLYQIIFEADTRAGKLFDVVLLFLILASVLAICLETVFLKGGEANQYSQFFYYVEWVVTVLFTLEYFARIIAVRRPGRYIFSFFGIIDLLAILPTYVAAVSGAGSSMVVLRAIRLLRVFRILKLVWLLSEANELSDAIWKARGKIVVFLTVVLIAVTIAGAVMYELEGPGSRVETFKSIPQAMYWAIVTMTTVGYGDLVPQTTLGRGFSALLILLGYSLIIVPTGFVSAEFIRSRVKKEVTTRVCDFCMTEGHDADAHYCKYCSQELVK